MTQVQDDEWSTPAFSVASEHDFYPRRSAASFGGGGGPGPGRRARDFVRRHGWRAFALPVLLVVTIVALFTTGGDPKPSKPSVLGGAAPAKARTPSSVATAGHSAAKSTPPSAPKSIAVKSDSTGSASVQSAVKAGALPAGPAYTKSGDGTFRVLPGTSRVYGASGQLFRYDIEVENGITGIDLNQFADAVVSTLADSKSWSGHGVRLQRVPQAQADFRITLTSALTVRQFCGYDIPIETSCYAKADSVAGLDVNRVVFDDARWVRGAIPYLGDLAQYRLYMINHEVGHALGHIHAHQCLPGGLAPTMMQQTIGLKSAATGKYCEANPWPYPPGVAGAPGAEQPDTARNSEFNLD